MEEFRALSKFTEEIKQMQQQVVKFKKHMNTQLERMDQCGLGRHLGTKDPHAPIRNRFRDKPRL